MFTYKSLLTAFYFSFFIYSEYYAIRLEVLNTLFAIMGIVSLFYLSKKELFVVGFFISILWFWWVGYSFVYYELSYLIPIVIFVMSSIYGGLFYCIGFYNNIVYKIGYIFLLSYINPFGFNWFKIELPFIYSYVGTSKIEFLIILVTLGLFLHFRVKYKKLSIGVFFLIFLSLYFYNSSNKLIIEKPKLKIFEYQTKIAQNKKWDRKYKDQIINDNILAINTAKEKKYDLIILPETAFPLVLNQNLSLDKRLQELSQDISIVTGSLYAKDGLYYNSTYFYENGKREVAHKVVLVPFGEAIPLPEKVKNFINNIFYNGAKDYETANHPTTFTIQNVKFRNSICYEVTTDEIYKNLDTSYVIAISNNGWFTPSIQPTLQKLLMKYYENKYKIYYVDVTNE